MDAAQPTTEPMTTVVGNCELAFLQPITYEPPMYLFPELLPKVPEGTAPLSVGDAVADGVDVAASSLDVAELFRLPLEELREIRDEISATNKQELPPTVTTLASLLASNRLQSIGLSAELLQRHKFSSGAIIAELIKLKNRARLNDEEAQAIMSNHFINLLAWRAAMEINSKALPGKRGREDVEDAGGDGEVGGHASTADSQTKCKFSCPRDDGTNDLDALKPSSDPWSADVDLHPGVFVAAGEQGVEKRIEYIDTLSKLFRRPWRKLESKGVQTDRFNPGVINETAPFADPTKLSGAWVDGAAELGWCSRSSTSGSLGCHWVLEVFSHSTASPKTFPICNRLMHFGRDTGVVSGVASSVANIHVGLGSFTGHPEFISPHHFTIAVLSNRSAESLGEGSEAVGKMDAELGEGRESGSCLWLINYGRNGTRVKGKQWVLGNMARLECGDIIQPTDDILIHVRAASDAGNGLVKDRLIVQQQ
ncbi:hypothetical protein ERJ75_000775100 [Trypanosoma vivax]|nr:hypothetical protein ERJ75_000775100 [Trypanosoma vivax]